MRRLWKKPRTSVIETRSITGMVNTVASELLKGISRMILVLSIILSLLSLWTQESTNRIMISSGQYKYKQEKNVSEEHGIPENVRKENSSGFLQVTTTVYHIGWDTPFGQTNNQLVAVIHALDRALDDQSSFGSGSSYSNHSRFVLAISGWALQTLGMFLSTATASTSTTRIARPTAVQCGDSNHCDWTRTLQGRLPFLPFARLDEEVGRSRRDIALQAGEMHFYTRKYNSTDLFAQLKERRVSFLGTLLDLIPRHNYEAFDVLTKYLQQKSYGEKYVTIHLRGLDGQCEWRVGKKMLPHECYMHPEYIKQLLRPHYGDDLLRKVPIVVISDMQRKIPLRVLQDDPDIGQNVIVPQWTFPTIEHSVVRDMMIAVQSDIFIGPRVSSMSLIIGQMRVALGKDFQTNLVFVHGKTLSNLGEFKVCGDCIFHCNETANDFCGERSIYV